MTVCDCCTFAGSSRFRFKQHQNRHRMIRISFCIDDHEVIRCVVQWLISFKSRSHKKQLEKDWIFCHNFSRLCNSVHCNACAHTAYIHHARFSENALEKQTNELDPITRSAFIWFVCSLFRMTIKRENRDVCLRKTNKATRKSSKIAATITKWRHQHMTAANHNTHHAIS